MKKVITNICNSLMAMSITDILQETGAFSVCPVDGCRDDLAAECKAASADIALLEVAYNPGFTVDERLRDVFLIRRTASGCKVLLMCDDNSAPDLARRVVQAKRDGLIDDFVYSSVSEGYLVAMLDSM